MAKRLRWKEYDYTIQVGPGNSWVYRPLITVEISAKAGEKVQLKAMIDSGTDSTILHAEIARKLQIDLARSQRVRLGGIGTIDGYLATVQLIVPDTNVVMKIPVVFAENLPFDGLLGQRHFFQRFKIRFEKDINKFYLTLV